MGLGFGVFIGFSEHSCRVFMWFLWVLFGSLSHCRFCRALAKEFNSPLAWQGNQISLPIFINQLRPLIEIQGFVLPKGNT